MTHDRGTLSGGDITNKVRNEAWGLSPTGNWSDYQLDADGDGNYTDATDLDQDRTHNLVNEITGITEQADPQQTQWADPAWDARGNMTTVPKPSDLTGTYAATYDAWNRLAFVWVDSNSDGDHDAGETVIARYEYDGLNRRTKKFINADTDDDFDSFPHFFYNAAWQILETRDADDVGDEPEDIQPEYQNIWSLRYIDAPVLRDKNTDTDDLCDDERLYFTNDANMNVTSLVGTDGTVLERYLYDPYGKLTVLDADFSADANGKSDYDNSILFCGYYHDWETGLALARRRYYHPLLGRWITRDPVRYQRKRQLYVYTQGKPLVETDPFGLKSASVLWTGILIQEHNTRESLQAVCGEKAGGCTKPSVSVTLNVEISFSTDLCYVGITEVKWGSTVHLPAEEVFGSIDPAMKEYESHREFLHSFPNKAWYNSKGVPRTYESILAHELTHGVQQYKAGQLATHYVINYYNFLEMFSYDTYAKAERERAKQEAGDDPERLILKDLDYHASILFPPGENFEPTEACEEEAVEEERKSLETQYQEWKAKQSQP